MMKINTMNCLNSIIRGVNLMGEEMLQMKANYAEEGEHEALAAVESLEDILHEEFSCLDISFKVLAGHLERIGNYAIETGDEKLIGMLKDMHVIGESTEQPEAA